MPSDWIEALGIYDAESGLVAAKEAREKILRPARRVLESSEHLTIRLMVFQGFVARAQALHESSTQMIYAENPHASFTLLRAYAENAAGILYAKDHPDRVDKFWDIDGYGIKIGTITNYARTRFQGFKAIYDQLSQFAHPQALGILSSASVSDDKKLNWSSVPHFKRPEEQVLAYAWVVELAEATRHLLYEFAHRYRLGYFAQQAAPDRLEPGSSEDDHLGPFELRPDQPENPDDQEPPA